MKSNSHPLWLWIVATLISGPLLYAASFGPACWIASQVNVGGKLLNAAYSPMMVLAGRSPSGKLSRAVRTYATLLSAEDWQWYVQSTVSPDGISSDRWVFRGRFQKSQ